MMNKDGTHTCPMFDDCIEHEVIEERLSMNNPPAYFARFGHEAANKKRPEIEWWQTLPILHCPFCGERIMRHVKRSLL